jgi:chromatin remodeling complex protein RSC6
MSSKQTSAKKTSATKTSTTPVAPKKASKKVEEPVVEQSAEVQKTRVRREVTKETVDADFNSLLERVESEITRLRESSDKVKVRGIKFLRTVSKTLKTLHADSKRVMKLKKKNARRPGVASGFLKPIRISAELASFTGWDVNSQYSRVEVTKFICKYIKDNNLFDQNDKRLILVDDKLKRLLNNYDPANPPKDKDGKPAPLNYFRLQRYLKNHFVKAEGASVPAQTAPVVAPKKATAPASKPAPKRASKKAPAPADDDEDVEDN